MHGPNQRYAERRKWQRELSAYWGADGNAITYCELRFFGCAGSYGLAPAHSKDRDEIYTKQDFFEVVAACSECHFHADRRMSKDERLTLFRQIIESRGFVCGCGQPIPPPLEQCSACEQVFSAQIDEQKQLQGA